jgi:hypothetical protein
MLVGQGRTFVQLRTPPGSHQRSELGYLQVLQGAGRRALQLEPSLVLGWTWQ